MRVAPTLVFVSVVFSNGCRSEGQPATPPPEPSASPAAAPSPIDPQKYYAVLLNNGTVYYGRLEGYGTAYPTLHDVFYVQRTITRDAKALSNVLIKRGQELHAPDKMILNPQAITFIEPVGPGSKIAGLIEQAQPK